MHIHGAVLTISLYGQLKTSDLLYGCYSMCTRKISKFSTETLMTFIANRQICLTFSGKSIYGAWSACTRTKNLQNNRIEDIYIYLHESMF